jgi:hypothetical protein
MSPSVGTARRAALGESTSSNRGTGSPRRSWSGPSGQSPLFAVTNAPSATSVTTARRSQRSRRPVSAHHQTWPMAPRNATAIAPWPARKARAAGDNRPLAMLARMASADYFVQTRGYRLSLFWGAGCQGFGGGRVRSVWEWWLISLSALPGQIVRGSCLGLSIPCGAVRRPESSGSLARQERRRGAAGLEGLAA